MEKRHAAGLRLIENILEDKNWNILLENNISDSDFLGDAAEVLKHVRDYFTNYSQFPDKEIVEEETLITFPKKVPLEHALKSFKNYQLSKKLSEINHESNKYLVRGDAESAYSYTLSNILDISPPSKIKGFKETAQERFENYKKKKMEGVKGIVPPWPSLAEAIVAWERGTLNAILGVSGTGKCVEESTLVTTGDGSRRTIKEVVENRLDIFSIDPETGEFEQKTPTDWFYSGEKDCFEIVYKSKDKLVVSGEHPILTSRGWIKTSDLKIGEIVARVGRLPEPKVTRDWDEDEITLFAAMMADGCMTRSEELTYTKEDPKLVQLMKEICERLGIAFYKRPSQENTYTWTLGKEKAWEILRKYGGEVGKSNSKSLKPEFFNLPNAAIKRFISVFWSHDGDVYVRNGRLQLTMGLSSKLLIDGIRQCLLRLGIFTTQSEGVTNFKTMKYKLNLPVSEATKFDRDIPLLRTFDKDYLVSDKSDVRRSENKSILIDSENVFWDRCSQINLVGKKRTYDLSVADTHSFEAGYTHVHNSWSAAVASYFAAFEQNAQVLLVTMENSKESMESRLDALYTRIPFGDMRQGWVDLRHEHRWQQYIQEMPEKQGDIIVVSGKKVRTVADIVQLSNSYNPSFVVVDGAYKLTGQGKEMWEKSSNVLEALHHAAEMSKAAWLATSQLNPAAEKAKGGIETAYNARGNKNWVTDPATVMTLTQNPDQRILNHVECRIAKIREAGDVADMTMTFLMLQDRTSMRFEEVVDEYLNEDILNSIID